MCSTGSGDIDLCLAGLRTVIHPPGRPSHTQLVEREHLRRDQRHCRCSQRCFVHRRRIRRFSNEDQISTIISSRVHIVVFLNSDGPPVPLETRLDRRIQPSQRRIITNHQHSITRAAARRGGFGCDVPVGDVVDVVFAIEDAGVAMVVIGQSSTGGVDSSSGSVGGGRQPVGMVVVVGYRRARVDGLRYPVSVLPGRGCDTGACRGVVVFVVMCRSSR